MIHRWTTHQMATKYQIRYADDDKIEAATDEAGRGCLMGRLYTGVVVLSGETDDLFDHGAALGTIKDSKKMSKRQRDIVYDYVQELALDKAVAFAEASEVDEKNVLRADMDCMHRALDSLQVPIDRVLVDGDTWIPYKDTEGVTIIDGDAKYLPIAAASILAKVARDRWVESVVAEHPEWNERYGFGSNMGYGTAKHMEGLSKYGVISEHRRSFRPVRDAMKEDQAPAAKKPKVLLLKPRFGTH